MMFRRDCFHLSYIALTFWLFEFPFLSSEETLEATKIMNNSQIESYTRDGFVVMKGVLPDELVRDLADVGEEVAKIGQKFPAFFSVVERGVLFDSGIGGPGSDETAIFREVALYSLIPQIAAELMQLDPKRQNLRVLRDIFLSKGIHDSTCDWHVDDQGFWPESYISQASKESGIDQDGVNVWIALDDMPIEYEGSMALSAGSHHQPWRFEAYEAMGQDRTTDGGHSKEEILAKLAEKRRTGEANLGACEIGTSRPDLREKLEEKKVVLDIKKGDIIFSSRTLFHRTLGVTDHGKQYYDTKGKAALNRYSIRYTPGTARLPNGWVAEWSTATNKNNIGSSLDSISRSDPTCWYPQVWPEGEPELDKILNGVASKNLKTAKNMVQQEIMEMFAPKPQAMKST